MAHTKSQRIALFAFALCILACNGRGSAQTAEPELLPRGQIEREVAGVAVTIYTPAKQSAPRIRGNVLVLPGWKFNRLRWLNETPIKAEADRLGLRLICPEMDRAIYASRYFPETTPGAHWNRKAGKAGLAWVLEDLLPYLQSQNAFRASDDNFLLGLSTGGRGVALIALARPELIRAASALSGDFNQSLQPADRLMTAVYGPHEQFTERWAGVDNPAGRVADWRTPLYLAHGTADRIVPEFQSRRFYEGLKAAHPELDVVLVTPAAGHDFAFWSAQTGPAFAFFQKYLRTDS